MQPDHILVLVLSVVTFALLVWIESRSRRNITAEEDKAFGSPHPDPPSPANTRRRP